MSTVLDEVTSDAINAKHVERRVENWKARLNGVYTTIGEWLPDDCEARRGPPSLMHEKMMREYGVAARRMPTLELHRRTGEVVKLKPRALWIIGNNGRVDAKRDAWRRGHVKKLRDILAALDLRRRPEDMNLTGFCLHEPRGRL